MPMFLVNSISLKSYVPLKITVYSDIKKKKPFSKIKKTDFKINKLDNIFNLKT